MSAERATRGFRLKAGRQARATVRAWTVMAIAIVESLAVAGEPPAPKTEMASETNTIEAAKRDLETIRALRNPALQPAQDLPAVATPELHLSNPELSAWQKQQRATKAQLEARRKAKNWLVEGVEREKRIAAGDTRSPRGDMVTHDRETALSLSDPLRVEQLRADDAAAAMAQDERDAESKETESDDERRESAAINPLANFMSAWMTPQDLALLQPNVAGPTGSAHPAAGFGAPPEGASSGAVNPISPAGGVDFSSSLLGGATPVERRTVPSENPYLQGLVAPHELDALFRASTPPPLPAAPAPSNQPPIFSPLPPNETMAPKSKIPEFAKPSDDDKYFKPLKRF